MNLLRIDVVMVVLLALIGLAAWLATYRFRMRDVGIAAGILLVLIGIIGLVEQPEGGMLVLDSVSFPRFPVIGLVLIGVFGVLPRREVNVKRVLAILLLSALGLLLVAMPTGLPTAIAWASMCIAMLVTLPKGPVRRTATPYMLLSGVLGVAGILVEGSAGDLMRIGAVAIQLGVTPFQSWVVTAFSKGSQSRAVAVAAPMWGLALVVRDPIGLDGQLHEIVAIVLALSAAVSGAMVFVQKDLSRAMGYFIASMGTLVLVGALDAESVGHLGGVIMWSVTGLALTGFGLTAASIKSRAGDLDISTFQGLLSSAPRLAAFFFFFGIVAVGAPGTAEFVSEDLVLHGSMAEHPPLLFAYIAAVSIQAYAMMHLFFYLFFGPERQRLVSDLLRRERLVLSVVAVVLLLIGLVPQLFVHNWLGIGAEALAAVVQP